MLHWWTSGGEAAALNVLKGDLAKEGYAWKDVPVAGGGGDAGHDGAQGRWSPPATTRPPSQMLGYTVLDYAAAGKMGDLTETAKAEGWDKAVPAALQKFSVYDGKWVAAPVNVHSVNWLWINKAVLDKIGGQPPKTFDELIAAARQGQGGRRDAARPRRPELAGSDDVRLGRAVDRRAGVLQEGDERPRRRGARSPTR